MGRLPVSGAGWRIAAAAATLACAAQDTTTVQGESGSFPALAAPAGDEGLQHERGREPGIVLGARQREHRLGVELDQVGDLDPLVRNREEQAKGQIEVLGVEGESPSDGFHALRHDIPGRAAFLRCVGSPRSRCSRTSGECEAVNHEPPADGACH